MKRSYITLFLVLIISFLLIGGCGEDKEGEYKAFADEHFLEDTYRQVEFELAINHVWGDSGAFEGTVSEWFDMEWQYRIHYLPYQGFTHELPTQEDRANSSSADAQYYEMIGKYIHQFGFGWDDAFGDDPETPYFDGSSPNSQHYNDLRSESNTGCSNILGN